MRTVLDVEIFQLFRHSFSPFKETDYMMLLKQYVSIYLIVGTFGEYLLCMYGMIYKVTYINYNPLLLFI